jgi:RND family efflux transporter MFP subunit
MKNVRLLLHAACLLAGIALLSACGNGETEGENNGVSSRLVSVTLAEVKTEEIQVELYSIGRLISKNTPTLAAEINARVIEFLVDEGQAVAKGQELILLDTTNTELSRREAVADIQRLEVSIANEERRVNRYRDLKKKDMMPQERLDDAEAKLAVDRASLTAALARLAIAEDRLAKARMVSPVNGVVEKRHVSVGDYAKVGSPLITVTDNQSLRAELPFPETVGARLKIGQELILTSPVAPGVEVQAAITQIRPQVGAMSRALVVISELTNPGPWRPEATVEASAVVERRNDAVVVPQMAVARRPAGNVIFIVDSPEARTVRQQVVELGERQNGHVEIISGISEGDIVVADGAYYLSDGAGIVVRESQP